MALYGSAIPLDGGATVVTVICPNAYSHNRLMQALNNIVPEAAETRTEPHHATFAPMPEHEAVIAETEEALRAELLTPEEPALRANPLGRDEE